MEFRPRFGADHYISLCGCGGDGNAIEGPTGTVSGKLLYKSKPVGEGYSVVFTEDSERGFFASGTTDSEGKYVLKTPAADQMPVGTYKVSITPPAAETAAADPSNPEAYPK